MEPIRNNGLYLQKIMSTLQNILSKVICYLLKYSIYLSMNDQQPLWDIFYEIGKLKFMKNYKWFILKLLRYFLHYK